MEIWKDVEGYDGRYQVSNLGNMRRTKFISKRLYKGKECFAEFEARPITISVNKRGYCYICLRHPKLGSQNPRVHQLVVAAFLSDSYFDGAVVNHKNAIQTDNRVENLEWCTQEQNVQHAFKMGLVDSCRGSRVGTSKLTEADVLEIRRLKAEGKSHSEIARQFGITKTNVGNIHTRNSWKHV